MRADVRGQPLADRLLEPHRGSRAPTHDYRVVVGFRSNNRKRHGVAATLIYAALLPLASAPGGSTDGGENRDPTGPFRRPLLAPARSRDKLGGRGRFGDPDLEPLKGNVHALLDNDRPSEAIRLVEDAVDRAGGDPFVDLQLRHLLAAALFWAGEYTRAAPLFETVGRRYRKYLPPTDGYVLDSAYHAGHAYAEIGNPDKALPQLRFYVQNADTTADQDEAAKLRDSRFVIAQMLAADGRPDEALTELDAVRPLLADALGVDSTQVRNLNKQIDRLRSVMEHGRSFGQ
jgi:tetratricopeptide (TPR) repeat protein